jgi:uncharacterized protein YegJ (DUF2314 family)
MLPTSLLSSLIFLLCGASRASFAADARFALALYCDPICDDAVLDGLEADLAPIPAVSGFEEETKQTGRLMGLLDIVPKRDDDAFGVPDADFIANYGVEVDRPERLSASQSVVIAWFASPRADAAKTLTIAAQAFANAATRANGWVEDLDTQRVYGQAAWARMDPAGPLTQWFVIEDNPADAQVRLITRGLRRFGDAELVMAHVEVDAAEDAAVVLNAVAATLHQSSTYTPIDTGIAINTDTVQGDAQLGSATPIDGDPVPPLLAVHFEGKIVAPAAAAQSLPATTDAPQTVAKPVPTTLAEAEAAMRERLESHRVTFMSGVPDGVRFAVSVPFDCPDGSREYLWVEVQRWEGSRLTGHVINSPTRTRAAQKGQSVVVDQGRVFDYLLKHSDGSREGDTVGAFVR